MLYDDNKFRGNQAARMLMNLIILLCVFFVSLIVAAGLASYVGDFFEPDSAGCFMSQAAVQNIVAFCGAAIATAYFTTHRPWHFLGVANGCSIKSIFGVIIVILLSLPAMNQLIYYNSIIKLPESMANIEAYMRTMEELNAATANVMLSSTSIGGLIASVLIVGILTGFSEELFFRGTLQRTLTQDRKMGQAAIWITAIIFSAVHLQFYGFFPRLLIGAFLGYMIYSTGSIWPGAFGHALNNSMVVVNEWLKNRGANCLLNDDFAVVKDGIPWPAIISIILLTIFLYFCYNYFFYAKKHSDNRLTSEKI